MADKKPAHSATYAADKKKGGYLVRVAGPHASAFVGREVPVLKKGETDPSSKEKLTKLIWSGVDTESGGNVALYAFEARPRDPAEEIEW